MAKCKNCGNWLPDNAPVCNVCNTPNTPGQAPQQYPQQPQQSQGPYATPTRVEPVHNTWSLPKTGQAPQDRPQPPVQPPVEEEPPKKKKGLLIALFCILGVLVVGLIAGGILLLTGDKPAPEDGDDVIAEELEDVLGRYEVVSCTMDGDEMEVTDEYIQLKKNSKAIIHLDGDDFDATWELDDEDLTLTQNKDTYYGTLVNRELTIDLDGMLYVFLHEDGPIADPAPAPEETMEPAPAPDAPEDPEDPAPSQPKPLPPSPEKSYADGEGWWAGDWYGWWVVDNGTGDVEDLTGYAFDVCANITVFEDGTGYVSMWDHDEGYTQSRWEVDVKFVDGADERGEMVSQGGTFWNSNLIWDDWHVDPTQYPYCNYENMICIRGRWEDLYDYRNTCDYYVFLRPWGTTWEDLRQTDLPGMPYSDMMPILYEEWYLPLILDGKGMPDHFPTD